MGTIGYFWHVGDDIDGLRDFLMLRLRGALQEPRMENVVILRHSVIARQVSFAERCGVVTDQMSLRDSVLEYVRYTGPPHTQTQTDRVR